MVKASCRERTPGRRRLVGDPRSPRVHLSVKGHTPLLDTAVMTTTDDPAAMHDDGADGDSAFAYPLPGFFYSRFKETSSWWPLPKTSCREEIFPTSSPLPGLPWGQALSRYGG